jgi:tetratricopeptide (TPR) repeat protein
MRAKFKAPILGGGALTLLWGAGFGLAFATGTDLEKVLPGDPAPCLAAIAAGDDDKIVSACGALIDNDTTGKADRIKALIARGASYARKDQLDRAIADYDAVLRLDPTLADIFNARGELWWRKGERRKALSDFGDALKLNPNHPMARSNYKRLALELERLGALMAVAGKPSFDCATARRPVEKAICANPELADLDRQIHAVNAGVVREAASVSPRAGRALQREQAEFLARRNLQYGRPGYDLQKAMRERLERLLGIDGY